MMSQMCLERTAEPQAGRDGKGQADIVHDIQPEVGKVAAAGDEAVDALGLGDIGEDGDECLDGRILEDEEPHLSVPVKSVNGALVLIVASATPAAAQPALLFLLRDREGGEEQLAAVIGRGDELAHEEEEIAQGDGLNKIQPWVDVDVGVGERDLEQTADGEDGEVATDPQDIELLIGPGQMSGMSKHEGEGADQSEGGAGPCDDLVDGEKVITAN